MVSDLVSVIVPIYNREEKLPKCVESILLQTYPNIEILLIDDGSKDASFSICLGYEKRFENVFAFHQKNAGPGSARNFGLKKARGKFVVFVDSDDTIEKNHIKYLMDGYKRKGCLVLCGYNRICNDYIEKVSLGNEELDRTRVIQLIDKWMLDPIIGAPWNKLIELDRIRKGKIIFSETLTFAEDFLFSMKLLDSFNEVITIDKCSYNYDSLSAGSLTKINCLDWKKYWEMQKEVYEQLKFIAISNSIIRKKILCSMMISNCIVQIKMNHKLDDSFVSDIIYNDEYKEIIRNHNAYNLNRKRNFLCRLLWVYLNADCTVTKFIINLLWNIRFNKIGFFHLRFWN